MGKLYRHYIESYHMDTPEWAGYMEAAGDLYTCPQVQKLEALEQHFLINRLQHIRSVAYMSYIVSKKLRLDYVTAARAATLHDLYYYDWRIDDWSHRPHGLRHPGFAVKNAYYLLGTLDKKTVSIIKRHMWPLTPVPPFYPEGWVVTMMDKYCAAIETYCSASKHYQKRFARETGIGAFR